MSRKLPPQSFNFSTLLKCSSRSWLPWWRSSEMCCVSFTSPPSSTDLKISISQSPVSFTSLVSSLTYSPSVSKDLLSILIAWANSDRALSMDVSLSFFYWNFEGRLLFSVFECLQKLSNHLLMLGFFKTSGAFHRVFWSLVNVVITVFASDCGETNSASSWMCRPICLSKARSEIMYELQRGHTMNWPASGTKCFLYKWAVYSRRPSVMTFERLPFVWALRRWNAQPSPPA